MRQKSHPKPARRTLPAGTPSPEIAELASARSPEAIERLAEIAVGADKVDAKAAKRALHLLRQAGVEVPEIHPTDLLPPPVEREDVYRAIVYSSDGAGNQSTGFLRRDRFGGSPYYWGVLINHFEGVTDVFSAKAPESRVDEMGEPLLANGAAMRADVPPEYARHLVAEASAINHRTGRRLPQGTHEMWRGVGRPTAQYAHPLVYEHLSDEALQADSSFSREPDTLFLIPLFAPWCLEEDDVWPWIERLVRAEEGRVTLLPQSQAKRRQAILDEATDALITPEAARGWRRALEETALVMYLSGAEPAAKQAAWHALSIVPGGKPHEAPFLSALVTRSISIVIALYQAMDASQEEDDHSPGDEPPSLIIRP